MLQKALITRTTHHDDLSYKSLNSTSSFTTPLPYILYSPKSPHALYFKDDLGKRNLVRACEILPLTDK